MKKSIMSLAIGCTALAMSGCIAGGSYYSGAVYVPAQKPTVITTETIVTHGDYNWRHRRWCYYHRYHPSCRPFYRRDNRPHYGAAKPDNTPHYGPATPGSVPHYGPAQPNNTPHYGPAN